MIVRRTCCCYSLLFWWEMLPRGPASTHKPAYRLPPRALQASLVLNYTPNLAATVSLYPKLCLGNTVEHPALTEIMWCRNWLSYWRMVTTSQCIPSSHHRFWEMCSHKRAPRSFITFYAKLRWHELYKSDLKNVLVASAVTHPDLPLSLTLLLLFVSEVGVPTDRNAF